jgi:hypothetical protein
MVHEKVDFSILCLVHGLLRGCRFHEGARLTRDGKNNNILDVIAIDVSGNARFGLGFHRGLASDRAEGGRE